jgi:hypothetical protein
VYFVELLEDVELPISGHVTVIEVSSASINIIPLFICETMMMDGGGDTDDPPRC